MVNSIPATRGSSEVNYIVLRQRCLQLIDQSIALTLSKCHGWFSADRILFARNIDAAASAARPAIRRRESSHAMQMIAQPSLSFRFAHATLLASIHSVSMFILFKIVFHFICSIGRFFRKLLQFVVGRRHEELGLSSPKTEPVTLEHIRIIGEMENDSNRPYQSSASTPTVNNRTGFSWAMNQFVSLDFSALIRFPEHNGILGAPTISFGKSNQRAVHHPRTNPRKTSTISQTLPPQ